ncbi:serine, glycine and glutamine-rich protein-like [Anoplophora glabripennis]|uniref:serine, glycine and glutamine-rich protein-like n=1 Tax=Anoplophora glabripennis TaxID=217634 RepID=UPI0008746F6A|nr:serine, glycine and glutamine-rich protein-like [Anoplophora glabripennis]
MWCTHNVVVFVLLLGFTVADEVKQSDRSEYKRALTKDCENSYSATCLKLDIVSWVDKLNEDDNYSVFPGVYIVRENSSARANTADIVADLARDFPNDPEARLDAFLLKKVQQYLSSHSVKLNLYENDNTVSGQARKGSGGGGGGGGKKGGGGMGMILAAAAMMKGTLMALAMGGLAALAGKALMTGLISLLLSAIIGLKSLSGGGGKTTYEVVSKPVYTHSNSHSSSHEDYGHHGGGGGHSGYGRSFDMPLPLGLQPEYKPQ